MNGKTVRLIHRLAAANRDRDTPYKRIWNGTPRNRRALKRQEFETILEASAIIDATPKGDDRPAHRVGGIHDSRITEAMTAG